MSMYSLLRSASSSPLVSTIVPTRNSAGTIHRCLVSLMPYITTGIMEVIVVDGQSVDDTSVIVKSFPVTFIRDNDLNPYAAREFGWRKARGRLIVFLDSDVFLGEGFVDKMLDEFDDDRLGIVGCWPNSTGSSTLSKLIGEWWEYHGRVLVGGAVMQGLIGSVYSRLVLGPARRPDVTGPCFVVRKEALDSIDGFRPFLKEKRATVSADHLLSASIVNRGWKSHWWVGGPVYHSPPATFRQLINRYQRWGRGDANARLFGQGQFGFVLLAHLASPLLGLVLSAKYHDLQHMPVFSLANLAWTVGYFATIFERLGQ